MIAVRFKRYFCYISCKCLPRGTEVKLSVELVEPGGRNPFFFSAPFWEARFKTSDSGSNFYKFITSPNEGGITLDMTLSPWLATLFPCVCSVTWSNLQEAWLSPQTAVLLMWASLLLHKPAFLLVKTVSETQNRLEMPSKILIWWNVFQGIQAVPKEFSLYIYFSPAVSATS